MTIKEQLEILRGEPIRTWTGDPLKIPCIETSDPEKLCRHPVVSVNMITYNHEPFIRQAIEGVMMQKTDFEFELVIGEDCSSDRTREICFEYQKRYPDKIRVLWAEQNVYKLGGNSRRCLAHSRGEFIAFCEGDDYWIDPLKLQRQVSSLRENPDVALSFGDAYRFEEASRRLFKYWGSHPEWRQAGKIPGMAFCEGMLLGYRISTLTVMVRRSVLECVQKEDQILSWRLSLGDYQRWISIAKRHPAWNCTHRFGVYRISGTGATTLSRAQLIVDVPLVDMYYIMTKVMPSQYYELSVCRLIWSRIRARHTVGKILDDVEQYNSKVAAEFKISPSIVSILSFGKSRTILQFLLLTRILVKIVRLEGMHSLFGKFTRKLFKMRQYANVDV